MRAGAIDTGFCPLDGLPLALHPMLTTCLYVPPALVVAVMLVVTATSRYPLHVPGLLLLVLGGTLYLHFGVGTPAARWWSVGIVSPVAVVPFLLVLGVIAMLLYSAITGEHVRWN